jgi:hypothetical protein
MKRFGILTSLLMAGSLGFAAPVLAAAPGNDTYGGRQAIDSLPFSASVDTTEATTDADDAEANDPDLCGAPATDASVWYEFVAPADGSFIVDVSTSDYPAGVIVVSGSPGSFTFVNCGPAFVTFPGTSGVTYAILVFDYDGVGNGGTLEITVEAAPPPPEVHLTVDATGDFNSRTGSATIRGTITCTGADEFDKKGIDVQVSQAVGRFKFTGQGAAEFACDGTSRPWTVEVLSSSGKFGGGKAAVVAHALACNNFGCDEDSVERVVTLKK